MDIINRQWAAYNAQKEQEKLERVKKVETDEHNFKYFEILVTQKFYHCLHIIANLTIKLLEPGLTILVM